MSSKLTIVVETCLVLAAVAGGSSLAWAPASLSWLGLVVAAGCIGAWWMIRRRASQHEAGRSEQWQLVVENHPDHNIVTDANRIIRHQWGEAIAGFEVPAVGHRLGDGQPYDLEYLLRDTFERVELGQCLSFEYDSNREEHIEARVQKIDEQNYLVVVRDVSGRFARERHIEQQKLELVQTSRLSTVGEIGGHIAHEINNPLAVIYSNGEMLDELLRENLGPDHPALRHTQKIVTTSRRIESIIKALQALAHDKPDADLQEIDLQQLVEDSLKICEARMTAYGIKLQVEIPAEKFLIECHPVQISQVILNLVNNARDAIMGLDDRWVKIDAHDLGDRIELVVMDSGQGLPPGLREKLFEPFFTTKEMGRGTGLGLSLSRSILEAHGGHIRIDDESVYTRFVVTLPKRAKRDDAA